MHLRPEWEGMYGIVGSADLDKRKDPEGNYLDNSLCQICGRQRIKAIY